MPLRVDALGDFENFHWTGGNAQPAAFAVLFSDRHASFRHEQKLPSKNK
jgi:hypothetical protein